MREVFAARTNFLTGAACPTKRRALSSLPRDGGDAEGDLFNSWRRSLCSMRSLRLNESLVGQDFFHALDHLGRLNNYFFRDRFQLLAAYRLHLPISFLGFGDELRIFERLH